MPVQAGKEGPGGGECQCKRGPWQGDGLWWTWPLLGDTGVCNAHRLLCSPAVSAGNGTPGPASALALLPPLALQMPEGLLPSAELHEPPLRELLPPALWAPKVTTLKTRPLSAGQEQQQGQRPPAASHKGVAGPIAARSGAVGALLECGAISPIVGQRRQGVTLLAACPGRERKAPRSADPSPTPPWGQSCNLRC
ncbi:unnamed protein product [Eretmochelys imbricata]